MYILFSVFVTLSFSGLNDKFILQNKKNIAALPEFSFPTNFNQNGKFFLWAVVHQSHHTLQPFSDSGAVCSTYFVEYRHRLGSGLLQRSRSVDYYVAHVRQYVGSGDSSTVRVCRRLPFSRTGCSSCTAGYQSLSFKMQLMLMQLRSFHCAGAAGIYPTDQTTPSTDEPLPRATSPMDGHGRAQQSAAGKNLHNVYNAAITSYFDE